MHPQQPGYWPPPRRSSTDVGATVVLSIAQAVASAVAVVSAAALMLWLMMPICSDNCDSPQVDHFVHQTLTAAAVAGGGVVVALLLAGTGIAVAAARRSPMWIWPAAGLGIVLVTYGVSVGVWMAGLPAGR
ncbi:MULTISPECIES: hypothetical protein [Mycobacterium]|uniref:Uncharacterized protein n=1 Tax=Mycobacterium kiyosense TaxID=2871094 RepID=A0A9P3Q1N5_9MYCO|nr:MULTISPECIES: hypothetical protein [Mycobacterium]BDB43480.1 hypothetical protein IWGMT90018_39260 [Mycobacterium kiyosense]BDE13359.1 hypothetical protein MKCMC460_22190 [Mycobacterium sp. 20KCMC460]GLB86567.1 hypothetical protein SRL2020028_58230 [Mycobacterium kiyosense]GLB92304.1 hypothetical protein SRL2020130_51210 [Mycobacterium kiyosense]GLB98288.1 hypothetical protein SRL2020226_50640 [Mycobacterium kiyosense]